MNVRLILSVVVTGFLMVTAGAFEPGFPAATSHAAEDGAEVARLKAEIEQLKGRLPSQSHAIIDVGYHFSNLWFAGQQQNWALAEFYLNETRSHLRWAVRIVPVRRTKAGEVDYAACSNRSIKAGSPRSARPSPTSTSSDSPAHTGKPSRAATHVMRLRTNLT
jgi:hypothetical protein